MNGFGFGRFGWDWDPWRDLRRLHAQMQRLLDGWPLAPEREFPLVNVYTNNDGAVLTAELPGVEPADLDVSVQGDTVTIKGQRRAEELKQGENYHRQERGAGSFARSVQLPFEVEPDKVEARLEKGVLTLTLPRIEADKPRKIAVKA